MALSPMMQQYFDIKNQYPDHLLFYRLGDFYEMFFDDAKLASRELELTLTGRDCGEEERAPMCGVPFHKADVYISRLVEKGYKVAVCEQMEDPALAKGLVKRDIIRVVTPGTILEGSLVSETKNNYLCAIYFGEDDVGLGFADISTGQVNATLLPADTASARLQSELGAYMPREILTNASISEHPDIERFIKDRLLPVIGDNQPARFDEDKARRNCVAQFGADASDKLICARSALCAVGALFDYIIETQMTDISYIRELNFYSDGQYLEIDLNTRRNLELTESMRNKEKRGSLLYVLDKTETAMGARLLRSYILHPLISIAEISRRQEAVNDLFSDFMAREELRNLLHGVLDLERLSAKIVYGSANARDLRAVLASITVLPELKALASRLSSDEFARITNELDELSDINALIKSAIVDDPPLTLREGGIIADGYDEEVDKLRSIMKNGKGWIEDVEREERESTGIKTLKVGYNRVFGYYIEVTKSLVGSVPDRYIRKQTLTNCERYITEDLKNLEATILGASDKLVALEYNIFQSIREQISQNSERIQNTASLLAKTDVYLSLADVASKNNYTCPTVNLTDRVRIKDGRHPVVEKFVSDSYFVPNDTDIDTGNNRLMLITGPNMAGKSTYMRQVALIVLMAQLGSFVPAASAEIGIVDKIFTRVGASDDLASGQSTFMLEMNEVAYILKNATQRSLIVYDEIGRGTSTYDGMSIARAVAEYTIGKKVGAKSLFATHYHELTDLEEKYEGVVNYNIAAKKRGDSITFLRKIVRGATDDSYGIEVAKLAGVPNEVVKRAKEILASIEEEKGMEKGQHIKREEESGLLGQIENNIDREVSDTIRNVDINTLTPIEAMNLIFELKKKQGLN